MDITITSETTATSETMWRAVTNGEVLAVGKSAGEALDSLRKQLGTETKDIFIVCQQWQPDDFFTAAQQKQLSELMSRWRAARDAGQAFPAEDQKRLEELVEAELAASAKRSEKLALEAKK
ncbi:MAG: hypothetical protein SF097_16415 [Acidobacteriota bacterium]|nr:hypothetical protein [Acidobacteriota bacterium]